MATETVTSAATIASPAEKLQLRAETSLNYEKEEVIHEIGIAFACSSELAGGNSQC